MKFQLLIFIIGLFNVIPTNGRLIQRNKTRYIEEAQTEKPNPSIRLTRDIENDSLTGLSNEDFLEGDDFIKSSNKRAKHFFNANPKDSEIQPPKRIVRDSTENVKATKIQQPKPNYDKTMVANPKAGNKEVLVKKPIPKFTDVDYDDFQSKMSNSRIIVDSGDHEDEDFNIGDYDFDVNHDEFNSGRKSQEPRTIIKKAEDDTKKRDMKIKNMAAIPDGHKTKSNIKERAAELHFSKTADSTKAEDYYDENATPTHITDDEYSDEGDNTKVLEDKSKRTHRSWNINSSADNYNNKGVKVLTRFLSVLPLFPQIRK